MNFNDLLNALRESDEALEADIDLAADVMDKVDSIKYVLDKIDMEVEHAEFQISELKAKCHKLEKNKKSLTDYVILAMQNSETPQIPGRDWSVKLTPNPGKINVTLSPDAEAWLEYNEAIKMTVNYAWDKKYLKDNIENYRAIASIEKSNRLTFSRKKV